MISQDVAKNPQPEEGAAPNSRAASARNGLSHLFRKILGAALVGPDEPETQAREQSGDAPASTAQGADTLDSVGLAEFVAELQDNTGKLARMICNNFPLIYTIIIIIIMIGIALCGRGGWLLNVLKLMR